MEKETGIKDVIRSTGTTRHSIFFLPIVMTALYKYAGLNNSEVGELLGVDYTTVSQGRKRLRAKVAKDRKIRLLIERIDGKVSRIKI